PKKNFDQHFKSLKVYERNLTEKTKERKNPFTYVRTFSPVSISSCPPPRLSWVADHHRRHPSPRISPLIFHHSPPPPSLSILSPPHFPFYPSIPPPTQKRRRRRKPTTKLNPGRSERKTEYHIIPMGNFGY
ncbi:hypothetical protein Dimus_005094, partial [Dionaea muscipula]